MAQDVFKILKDLEYKAVGVDPQSNKVQEGYFVSFRNVGLPIPREDFENPWDPFGANLKKITSDANATVTASTDATKHTPIDINQLLTAGIGQSIMNYVSTYWLTNDKLRMNKAYSVMPDASHVDDAWYAIINGANAVTSDMELSDAIKKSVEVAKAKVMDKDGNPTAHYSAYAQYRETYMEKVKSLNRAYANAMSDPMKFQRWPIDGKLYQDDVNDAWDQWNGFGFKQEIEQAMNLLAAQGMDPALALIARAKKKWENALVHFDKVGDTPYTFILPRKWYSADEDDGWTGYSEADFHSESHFESESSSWSAGGGFSLGFFSIGGSASSSTSRTDFQMKTTNLKISFEYCSADIIRPWLDTTLLRLGNWFLVGDYPQNCISDGTFGQEIKPSTNVTTFLPSVVTSLILVRNLVIYCDEMNEHVSTFDSTISGGGAVGYGPFFVGGKYSHSNSKRDFSYDFQSDGLHINGVQLIGYVSAITPPSPHLNSKDFMQKTKKETDPAVATP